MILLDFVAANICVYFQYLFMHFVCANIFGAIVLKPRFKIDVVVVVIWSIVIIINSVLTLQVSTASLSHDREPCEIKVVSNHTCSLHTCVCAGSRRVRICLSGFRRQESVHLLGVSSSALFQSGSVPNSSRVASLNCHNNWLTTCKDDVPCLQKKYQRRHCLRFSHHIYSLPRRPIARGSARHAIHPSHAAFTGKSSQRNKIKKQTSKRK